MADNIVQTVTISMFLKELVSGPSSKVNTALTTIGKTIKNLNKGLGGGFSGILGVAGGIGLASGIEKVFGVLEKCIDLAKAQGLENDRLGVALDGNVRKLNQIQSIVLNISKKSVFGQTELTGAAESLVQRGVPLDKIPQALQVVADTAAALHKPIEEVATQIASTFGGKIPRDLGRAVPALRNLTQEALRSGGALGVLAKRFGGEALEQSLTPSGKALAAARDIQQAMTDIGKAILPIQQTILPEVAKRMKDLSLLFDKDSVVTWGSIFGEIIATILGDLAVIPAFIGSMSLQVVGFVVDAFQVAVANGKFWIVDLFSYLINQFRTTLTNLAKQLDAFTAKLPAWMGGKTNLAGFVQTGLSSAALDAMYADANASAKKASDKLQADLNSNVWNKAWSDAMGAHDAVLQGVRGGLGLDVPGAAATDKNAAQIQATKDALRASDARKRQQDQADEIEEFKSLLNVRGELTQEQDSKETATALESLKVEFDARKISLEQYYAQRRQLELGALDEQLATYQNKVAPLLIQAFQDKLAGNPATESLKQLHDLALLILPIEDKRAETAAKIADEELKALDARKQLADQLTKEDSIRRAKASATISHGALADQGADALGQIGEQRIQQEAEIAELKAKQGVTDQEIQERQKTQLIEVDAKRVDIAKQLAEASVQEAEAAKDKYQSTLDANRNAVAAGEITSPQAVGSDAKALDEFKARIREIADALAQLRQQGLIDPQQFADAEAKLDSVGNKTKRINEDAQKIGVELKNEAINDLAKGITDVELKAKSAKQALLDMAKSFLTAMLNIINQRVAERLVDSLIGGTGGGSGDGSGIFGFLGSLITGVITGSVGSSSPFAGGGTVPNLLPGNFSGAAGGYTGDGPLNKIAGVVHHGEFVIPNTAVRKLSRIGSAFAPRMHLPSALMGGSGLGVPHLGGNDSLAASVHALASAVSDQAPKPAIVHIGSETAQQFFSTHSESHLRAIVANPNYARSMASALKPYLGGTGK